MMVSKVAVIALVAIIAVPILLGYGFNLSETTEERYENVGDPVIVTQLLQNDVGYTYANASPYQLNSRIGIGSTPGISTGNGYVYPRYVNNTSIEKSSIFGNSEYGSWGDAGSMIPLRNFYHVQRTYFGITQSGYVNMIIGDNGNDLQTVVGIYSFNYDDTTKTLTYICQTYNWDYFDPYIGTYDFSSAVNPTVSFVKVGSWNDRSWAFWDEKSLHDTGSHWVDLSSGFYLEQTYDRNYVVFPENTRSLLMTMNLDSITSSSYSCTMSIPGLVLTLTKTTTGGVVSWQISGGYPVETIDLYYDPARSNNTYQFYFSLDETQANSTYQYYNVSFNARYVGGWPKLFGEANYYQSYSINKTASSYLTNPLSIDEMMFNFTGTAETRTPTIRFDDARFRAFEYPIVKDREYVPSTFKANPSTSITDVVEYGSGIKFGGNTYTVSKDGYITINSHQIPVNKLVLSSVLNDDGNYDNMIGNTIVSVTAQPSRINFDGSWSATILTDSMETVTYTKTEWTPGDFGWDGIDQNFLMVGLLTSIGVFIALGIAYRKTKAALGALLVVCGGAILLFFTML